MKTINKRFVIISLFLALVLALPFVLSGFSNSVSVSTRTINVSEIGTLSYEELTDKMLYNFDVYSSDFSDDCISFEGNLTKDFNYFSNLQHLALNDNDKITEKYETKYNIENDTFLVKISYFQDDKLVEEIEHETVPVFDEEKNDYFIELENGNKISVAETIKMENIDNCIAIVDDVAIILTAALAITVAAAAPVITTVVTKVVNVVKSIFSWFASLFVKKTVTQTTKVATPLLILGNTTYKTEAKTEADVKKMDQTKYFAAFADPTNGNMYMTVAPILEQEAVAILLSPSVSKCIGNSERTMISSTYTYFEENALRIAEIAGLDPRTPAGHPDLNGNGYYRHYHSIATALTIGKKGELLNSHPHSFFGLPVYY